MIKMVYFMCFLPQLKMFLIVNYLMKRGKFDEKQYTSMVVKELLVQGK